MSNTYLIWSLVAILFTFSAMLGAASVNDKNLVYSLSIAIIPMIASSLYFGFASPAEKRTSYPEWDNSTSNVAVDAGTSLWRDTPDSNRRPPWASVVGKDETIQRLTANWIEDTVLKGGTEKSATSTADDGIAAILVRNNSGISKPLPIMDFFKKLNDDMVLGWLRAKDYVDYREKVINDTINSLTNVVYANQAKLDNLQSTFNRDAVRYGQPGRIDFISPENNGGPIAIDNSSTGDWTLKAKGGPRGRMEAAVLKITKVF
jgi:hypothetical protein